MRPKTERATAGRLAPSSTAPEPARARGTGGSGDAAPDRVGRARAALGHAPFVLVGLAVLWSGSMALAFVWCALCRLGYVGFVWLSLRAESRRRSRSSPAEARERSEARWLAFRKVAASVMFGDAVAMGVLCLVTRGTLDLSGPVWSAAGLVLIALGLGVKSWASASLDPGTFYWRDFFVPEEHRSVSAAGPYRWLSDPMYSVGYAHAYGFALLLRSWPGLVGAAFAQLAVLLLARLVERPYVLRLVQADSVGGRRPPPD